MGILFDLLCSGIVLLIGLFAGGSAERRHFRSLDRREAQLQDMILPQTRQCVGAEPGKTPPQVLVAEVVIASDALKRFFANWKNIFGGELRSYQTLMERARREAALRIMEQARELGYNAVCNLRLETADIAGGAGARRTHPMAAILASATAYHARRGP